MDSTYSTPADDSMSIDSVVYAQQLKEYVTKPEIQKIYDGLKKCGELLGIANKAIDLLKKTVAKDAIIKTCPALLNVKTATELASILGPAAVAVGIGADLMVATGLVEDHVTRKLNEISRKIEQLRKDVEMGFENLMVHLRNLQVLESFLPVYNNLHMNVVNYEGILPLKHGSNKMDQSTYIKRLGLMVKDYSPNMIIRDLRQMHALIVGKGAFSLGKSVPLFERLEEELNGLEGKDADEFIGQLLLQFQAVVGLQVRAIRMLRAFVTYCRNDVIFCDDMKSIFGNLAMQRQQYDPALKFSEYITFKAVGGEFTLIPQKYPETQVYVDKPFLTALFGKPVEPTFGKGKHANRGVLIATPCEHHDGTFLISSKMWPHYYFYIMQTPLRELVASEGDPGPKGHWDFSAIDPLAGVFRLSTSKWPTSYLCTRSIPVLSDLMGGKLLGNESNGSNVRAQFKINYTLKL